jgi:hypothetical protein
MPDQWKELYQFTRRMIQLTVVVIAEYHSYELRTKFYPISFSQGSVHMYTKLLAIISVGFDNISITGQISCICQTLEDK